MRNTDLTKRSRRLYRLLGAGLLSGCVFVAYLGVRQSHSGSSYLEATFDRAGQGLDTRSDVKIRGINVGGVDSVKLDGNGHVRVRIRINHGVKVPTTSSLAIQPLSIFGPKYIALDPGTGEDTGPYLSSGATITRTTGPRELTDVVQPAYDLLSAIDPADLNAILHTFAQGVRGRGPELADTIDNATKLLDLTARNKANIEALIGNGVQLAGTFGSRGDEISRLAADINTAAPAVTGDPAALDTLLTGSAQLSAQLTEILDSDPNGPGRIITSLIPATDILYQYRGNTPSLISGVAGFFNQAAAILQSKGPNGTLLGTQTTHLDLSNPVCSLVIDLCGPYPKALPYPKLGGN